MDIAKIRVLMDAGLSDEQIASVLEPGAPEPEPAPEEQAGPEAPEDTAAAPWKELGQVLSSIIDELGKINGRIDKLNIKGARQAGGAPETMSADDITKMLLGGKK